MNRRSTSILLISVMFLYSTVALSLLVESARATRKYYVNRFVETENYVKRVHSTIYSHQYSP